MIQITITKIEEKPTIEQKYQQVANSGNPRDGGPIYEYVPVETVRKVEMELLKQCVEKINLVDVICAINGICKEFEEVKPVQEK